MRKSDTTIAYVEPFSLAARSGIVAGDVLFKIKVSDFYDILE